MQLKTRFRRLLPYAPALALIIAMRLRFIFAPITSDEGGILAIARAWNRGATLYKDVWADRPQGLFIVYRFFVMIGLGNPAGVRILALVACIAGAIACGSLAAALVGDRARWSAALLVGVFTSVPQFEGFIANGELLSSACGAIALAMTVRAVWNRPAPRYWLLYGAGIVGGCALSMKQSGFDALATAYVVVLVMVVLRRWQLSQRLLALPVLSAGVLTTVALMIVQASLDSFYRWWYAVVLYRMELRSAVSNANWARFQHTFDIAWPLLVPVVFGVIVIAIIEVRRIPQRTVLVPVTWLAISVAAFMMGGQFFRHYWVILMFPLGTLAGIALSLASTRLIRFGMLVVLIFSPMVHTAYALTIPRWDIGRKLHDDARLRRDERIAKWFKERAAPGDVIYPLCASAGLYGKLDFDPTFPYLWGYEVKLMPGDLAQVWNYLNGPNAPRFVAEYQKTRVCDPSGATFRALNRNYRLIYTVAGLLVYEHRSYR
jgi:4-amino-4-deoxy-L-arabinose transferase-like glycosyltransferase